MKCKLCEYTGNWDELSGHWMGEHPADYHAVQAWLGNVDDKLPSWEQLASEGMRGHKEVAKPPRKLAVPHVGDSAGLDQQDEEDDDNDE